MNLFDGQRAAVAPLADRMRPRRLAEVVGQRHLLGSGQLLSRLIRADKPPSMVLWGPPGTGKTTLAQVIAGETAAHFISFSAVLGGVPELRKRLAEATERARMGKRTILFVDEIHRFNKAQQDALLPHVENGTVTLVGATTENPSFAVNAALLSRARVFRLESLDDEEVAELLARARDDARGLGGRVSITDDALLALAEASGGDARRALSTLETLAADGRPIDVAAIQEALGSKTLRYDKAGEEHYNVVSALIKSMRGSDPDAAVYWLMRMLDAGEDPRFVARRLLIFASEDVGNADPRALSLAIAADQALQRLGLPEALHALSQCAVYLAIAPKSNASYKAFLAARADIERTGALPVPMHLRNAPTRAMKEWGYGKGYRYPHDEGGFAQGESYLPERLAGRIYYEPSVNGLEGRVRDRIRARRGQGSGKATANKASAENTASNQVISERAEEEKAAAGVSAKGAVSNRVEVEAPSANGPSEDAAGEPLSVARAPAERSSAKGASVEKPSVEKPSVKKPATGKAKKATSKKATSKKGASKKTTKKAATKKSASKKKSAKKTTAQKSAKSRRVQITMGESGESS